jgi:hypothetical protein
MNNDELLALISLGESPHLEFKSTLRYDVRFAKVNKDLTKVIAKTVAGFLNSEGGTLLIGVEDNGSIFSIRKDLETLSKQTNDYFELTLRNALGLYLGVEMSAAIGIAFVSTDVGCVAVVTAVRHHEPVFFQDGDTREFYIRDGNSTRPLNVMSAHKYIANRFKSQTTDIDLSAFVRQVIDSLGIPVPSIPDHKSSAQSTPENIGVEKSEVILRNVDPRHPRWLKVSNARVIDSFLKQLGKSVDWKRIHIVSPWISEFNEEVTLRFSTFLDRIVRDRATVYIVTRPPEEDWHEHAVQEIAKTGRANIVFVKNLHAKLYTASTSAGDFALLGSANFTQNSLNASEIGVLVNGVQNGKAVVRRLLDEARRLYRHPERNLVVKASFSI